MAAAAKTVKKVGCICVLNRLDFYSIKFSNGDYCDSNVRFRYIIQIPVYMFGMNVELFQKRQRSCKLKLLRWQLCLDIDFSGAWRECTSHRFQ